MDGVVGEMVKIPSTQCNIQSFQKTPERKGIYFEEIEHVFKTKRIKADRRMDCL
jgi:hypothetical protein